MHTVAAHTLTNTSAVTHMHAVYRQTSQNTQTNRKLVLSQTANSQQGLIVSMTQH